MAVVKSDPSSISVRNDNLSEIIPETLGNIFGQNTDFGGILGNFFSQGVSSATSTIGKNILKGQGLTEGLSLNVGQSLGGTAVGLLSQGIGKGITSLGGDSKLARGLGQGIATGVGTIGGLAVGNLLKGQKAFKGISDSIKAIKAAKGTTDAAKLAASAAGKWNLVGLGGQIVGSGLQAAFGPSNEYNGKYGTITLIADAAYDIGQGVVSTLGPVGMGVSGLMALNKGLSNVFGSTSGMCVCAGTKVYTADGRYINIEDLKQEDGILGWNEKTHEIRPLKIECLIEPRLKECVEIELDNGRKLKCSIDHPILSNIKEKAESHRINGLRIAYREWEFRRANELKIGNWVGLANNIDYWGNKEMPNAYLVGMLIGDGTYTYESSCKLWTADPSTWKYLEENNLAVLIEQYTPENSNGKYSIENRSYRIINGMQLVKDLGIAYQKGTEKTLPKNIDLYNKDSICKLIAGLFDTDGSFSGNKEKGTFSLTLYLSNLNLLKEVQHLLYKLGIVSNINTRKASINKMKNGKIINSNISYRLELTDRRSILKFRELIPINIDYKKTNLDIICEIVFPKKDKDHYELSGARLAKIISITKIGVLTVYNLEVTEDHTYLANDIITHNTVLDAILGSAFMPAPVKWLNMAGAKTTDTFKNLSWQNSEKANSFMGNAFGNLGDRFDQARDEAGKTYGLFSRGAYGDALDNINFANNAWNKILAMADLNEILKIRSQYMSSINNQRYAQLIQGGFNPIARGKQGMKIFNNATNHNIGMRLLSAAALIDNKQMILSAQGGTKILSQKPLEELVLDKQKAFEEKIVKPIMIGYDKNRAFTLTNAGSLTGAHLSEEMIEYIVLEAEKAGIDLQTALGIVATESTFGNPTDDKSSWKISSGIRREFNNVYPGTSLHINTEGDAIDELKLVNFYDPLENQNPYTLLLNEAKRRAEKGEDYNKVLSEGMNYADKLALQPIPTGSLMLLAFEYFKKYGEKYNPGYYKKTGLSYVKHVLKKGKEALHSPEIQQAINNITLRRMLPLKTNINFI